MMEFRWIVQLLSVVVWDPGVGWVLQGYSSNRTYLNSSSELSDNLSLSFIDNCGLRDFGESNIGPEEALKRARSPQAGHHSAIAYSNSTITWPLQLSTQCQTVFQCKLYHSRPSDIHVPAKLDHCLGL
jgi:hypothetical protein